MKVIEVKNLSKYYKVKQNKDFKSYITNIFKKQNVKEIKAVENISFNINLGECVGLIGTNGAGKSTTIKMLTGILKPTNGEIEVLGKDPYKFRQVNNFKIGAIFGQRCQLRWDLSPYESYKLLKSMYKVSDNEFYSRYDKLKNMLYLDDFIHQPVRTLSLGQKMRAEFCAAFLHNPEIIFLDEPTIGLDIFSKEAILNFLKEIKKSRKYSIILTTHDISDISELSDRVIVINKGTILLNDSLVNIQKNSAIKNNVVITTSGKKPIVTKAFKNYDIKISDYKLEIFNINNDEIPLILGDIFKNNNVKNLKIEDPDFKDIIKDIYLRNNL